MNRRNPFILRKERKFGEKIEASFEFIRLTRKPLFKSLLFYTGPFVLLGMFLVGYIINSSLQVSLEANTGQMPSADSSVAIVLAFMGFLFLSVFAGAMVLAVIYSVIRLYEEVGSEDFTHKEVWKKTRKIYWPLFGTIMLYGIIFGVLFSILAVVITSVMLGYPFLSVFILYSIMAVFMIILSLATSAQAFERKSIGSAFSYSLKLLKNNWWASIGLFIVLLMIYNAIMPLFTLPYYLNVFIVISTSQLDLFTNPPLLYQLFGYLLAAILLLGSFFTYSISVVGMSLQYFSLSEEKDAKSLILRISQMGQTVEEEEEGY